MAGESRPRLSRFESSMALSTTRRYRSYSLGTILCIKRESTLLLGDKYKIRSLAIRPGFEPPLELVERAAEEFIGTIRRATFCPRLLEFRKRRSAPRTLEKSNRSNSVALTSKYLVRVMDGLLVFAFRERCRVKRASIALQ